MSHEFEFCCCSSLVTQWHFKVCVWKVVVNNLTFPSGLTFMNTFYASPNPLENPPPTQAKKNNSATHVQLKNRINNLKYNNKYPVFTQDLLESFCHSLPDEVARVH